jgi:hypothetical protein
MKRRTSARNCFEKQQCIAVILAVVLAFMPLVPGAMAMPGKLWLDTISSTYVGDNGDAWLAESSVTSHTEFDLEIYYHHGADIHHLYLLVAVNESPANNDVTVKINGTPVSPYDGVITNNNKARITETVPAYELPGHGIYNNGSDVKFEVVNITALIPDDRILSENETVTVHVEIIPHNQNPVKVHFDAVGADRNNNAVACNPFSHDVTYNNIPEFATIAIPVALILGLFLFFNHRKRSNQSPAG